MSDIHLLLRSTVGTWITSSPLPVNKYKKIGFDGTLKSLNMIQSYASKTVQLCDVVTLIRYRS